MVPMFPKGYDKDKWYMTKDVMPDKPRRMATWAFTLYRR